MKNLKSLCILFLALLLLLAKQYRSNEQYEKTSLLIDFQEQVSHIENLLAMVNAVRNTPYSVLPG